MRRVAVVTGSRAEYGLLRPILRLIGSSRGLKLQLIVTGEHLLKGFGLTVSEIEADGFAIAARVPLGLKGDRGEDIARAMGTGVKALADCFQKLRPDLLLLLGDRFEILAAACAALPLRLPVAHVHGGESSEGVIDEAARHAVTKMSHLHFTSTEAYRERLMRMGENPRRVFAFGAPGLDGIAREPLIGRPELFRDLGIPEGRKVGVVTYHPVTLENGAADGGGPLFEAISGLPEVFWLLTYPHAEAGSGPILRSIQRFLKSRPGRAAARASLGRTRYLSLLRQADLMVGNSSSGLLEAPSFALPAVNVGDRQRGRLRAANVIDAACRAADIRSALRRALDPGFKASLKTLRNPYAGDDTCRRIVSVLEKTRLGEELLKKRFHDGP